MVEVSKTRVRLNGQHGYDKLTTDVSGLVTRAYVKHQNSNLQIY